MRGPCIRAARAAANGLAARYSFGQADRRPHRGTVDSGGRRQRPYAWRRQEKIQGQERLRALFTRLATCVGRDASARVSEKGRDLIVGRLRESDVVAKLRWCVAYMLAWLWSCCARRQRSDVSVGREDRWRRLVRHRLRLRRQQRFFGYLGQHLGTYPTELRRRLRRQWPAPGDARGARR